MNSVERTKEICKIKRIPISRLEKDLGFANGYIGQLKKGTMPADRLAKIADYLGVSQTYLLYGEKEKPTSNDADELDKTLIKLLCDLDEEETTQVRAFVQGILAARAKKSSLNR
jgi:transcriptional regulator with XRE-family HTH domain